jgi:uncharacterized protein
MSAWGRARNGSMQRDSGVGCRATLLLLALIATFTAFVAPAAHAQSPSFNWFQQWFQPQRPAYYYPPPQPRYAPQPRYSAPSLERRRRVSRPATPKPAPRYVEKKPTKPAKPTVPPSFFVAVLGDSLGQMLGQGLVEAFSERPEVAILRKAREDSGLVRNDFYDWVKGTQDLLASNEKINVAVMLIGINDHQNFRDGPAVYEPHAPKWDEIYAARIENIAGQFRDRKIPLIWVGLPIMKSDRISLKEALALNELYKEHASKAGATYVDIWEAFGDERGAFASSGPDVQGQLVKLRSSDGVHFTKAGARKLAHFVEEEINRVLDATEPKDDAQFAKLPPGPQAGEAQPGAAAVTAKPSVGPVLPLTILPRSPDGSLVSRTSADAAHQTQLRPEQIFGKAALDPRSGTITPPEIGPSRADDFSWPRP